MLASLATALLHGDADANDRAWHAAGGDQTKTPFRDSVDEWLDGPIGHDREAGQRVMRMLAGGVG